jgi:hypothetical protein
LGPPAVIVLDDYRGRPRGAAARGRARGRGEPAERAIPPRAEPQRSARVPRPPAPAWGTGTVRLGRSAAHARTRHRRAFCPASPGRAEPHRRVARADPRLGRGAGVVTRAGRKLRPRRACTTLGRAVGVVRLFRDGDLWTARAIHAGPTPLHRLPTPHHGQAGRAAHRR